jgi:hypothetical protein
MSRSSQDPRHTARTHDLSLSRKIWKFGDAEKKGNTSEGLMGLSVGQAAGRDCGVEKSEPWGQDCESGSRFLSSGTKLNHQTPNA